MFQTYLANEDVASTNRLDQFLFYGCPIGLSENLEQPPLKVNYLQQKMDEMMCGTKPSSHHHHGASKDKMTATQANQIAVDLGMM